MKTFLTCAFAGMLYEQLKKLENLLSFLTFILQDYDIIFWFCFILLYEQTHTATYVPFFCYLYQCFIIICFLVDCMFEIDKRNLSIIKLLLLYIHIKIVLIINCTTVDLARNQIKSGEYTTQILTPSNEPMKKYL